MGSRSWDSEDRGTELQEMRPCRLRYVIILTFCAFNSERSLPGEMCVSRMTAASVLVLGLVENFWRIIV